MINANQFSSAHRLNLSTGRPSVELRLDREGYLRELGDGWSFLTGRSTGDCLGTPLLSYLTDVHPDDFRRMVSDIVDGNRPSHRQCARLSTAAAESLWVTLELASAGNSADSTELIAGVIRAGEHEATSSNPACDAAYISAGLLRALSQQSKVFACTIDSKGVFTSIYGADADVHAIGAGAAIGVSSMDCYQSHPQLTHAIQRALCGEQFAAPIVLDDSNDCYDINFQPLLDDCGRTVGAAMLAVNATDRQDIHEKFIHVAEALSMSSGERFFQALVQTLATALGADCAIAATLERDGRAMRTLAAWSRGHFVERFRWPLAGSAVEKLYDSSMTVIHDACRQRFPADSVFADLETDAMVACPLFDSNGDASGLVAVMYAGAMRNCWLTEALLRFVATVAAAELERVATQSRLSQANQEWDAAVNSFEEAVVVLDKSHGLLRANRSFLNSIDSADELAAGAKIPCLVHGPGTRDDCPVCHATQLAMDSYLMFPAEHPLNVQGYPVEVAVRTIRDESGEAIGCCVSRRDLSRLYQAEQERDRLNRHLGLLLESTSEGIYGVDIDMRCTFINRAGATLLHYGTEELIGHTLHNVIHYAREDGAPYDVTDSYVYRAMCDSCSYTVNDEVFWRRDKIMIPVQYTVNPIYEKDSVVGAVVVFRNVAEARAMTRRMDFLAKHDTLTGLKNRFEFERRLQWLLSRTREEGVEHVLCYMDLDQFKVVNDTCGHAAGDQLLRQLSTLLSGHIRKDDMLARLGGDEFGVLLQYCCLSDALRLVDNIRDTVREFRFVWDEKTFVVGISIGIVTLDVHTRSLAAALGAADAACYMAKDSGRNRYHVYQHDDAELVRRHGEMQWVSRIHQALEQQCFELWVQPLIANERAAQSRRQFEVLLRMRLSDGSLVPPGAFFPAAERYNLVAQVDRWVVAETFRWLREHRNELSEIDFCSINLSGQSVGDEQFLGLIRAVIFDSGFDASKICFEITETAAVSNLAQAIRFMKEMKRLGCRFALDDFGSGMSSFAYLKSLPIDFLKIDGTFVKDIAHDPVDLAMVESINQVGHVMGLKTIAEFVEEKAIADKVQEIGIDYLQGNGIARPEPLMTKTMLGR